MIARLNRLLTTSACRIGMLLAIVVVPLESVSRAQQADTETGELLQKAQSATSQSRYAAIDTLGIRHIAADEVVPVLTSLLADADVQVRWRSARALGDYGSLAQVAVPKLRDMLGEDDTTIRYHVAVALGRIGDRSDETIRALVSAITRSDKQFSRAGIAALRRLKPDPEQVMPALQQALESGDSAVVLHALEAIVEQGAAAVPFLNEALKRPQLAYLACAAIDQIGPDAAPTVPALTELLKETSHSQMLIQALIALASIGPEAKTAAASIIPLLEVTNDDTVPAAAAYALGAIEASDADAALRQAMTRDKPFLQMAASWALAKLHPEDQQVMRQAVEKLVQGLSSDDATIRTAAARGLQMLQPPAEYVAPALIALADDPDPEVSANIVHSIASLGASVVPRVCRALQEPKLRELALRVLTQLGPEAADAVAPLIDAIPAADPHFRAEIQAALAAIGPKAAPATKVLTESLTHEDKRVRHSALYALRQIGPGAASARQPLLALVQADDAFESMAAAWALATIANTDSEIAAKAVPALTRGLSAAEVHIRLESIEALAAFGTAAKPAIATLNRIARQDDDPRVRAAAKEALDRIATDSPNAN